MCHNDDNYNPKANHCHGCNAVLPTPNSTCPECGAKPRKVAGLKSKKKKKKKKAKATKKTKD